MSDAPERPSEDICRAIEPGQYYGHGLPYLPIDGYPGKIIAIEGTAGVGRSTQIGLLREWLEVQGYGVVETGWTRSALMQPTIDLAKASNTLNKLTFVLLYATDFADRLEKEVIPALKEYAKEIGINSPFEVDPGWGIEPAETELATAQA